MTVKCRIGVDDHDSYDDLCGFVEMVASAMVPMWTDGRLLPPHTREEGAARGSIPGENPDGCRHFLHGRGHATPSRGTFLAGWLSS